MSTCCLCQFFSHFRFFVLTAVVFLTPQTYSAERIRADVVTDIRFISPGETEEIHVTLVNPQDSGTVIKNAVFSFNREVLALLQQFPFLEILDSTGCPLEGRRSVNYGFRRACEHMKNDVFPVNPGESVRLTFLTFILSDEASPGAIIKLKDIALTMYDSHNRQLPELYMEREIVRVVADDGVSQSLPQISTKSPKAGLIDLNMTLLLQHPERVKAGDSFTIEGTLINNSDEQFTVNPYLSPAFTNEFHVIPCISGNPCNGGQFTIEPHQSVAGITFDVQYVAPLRKRFFWDVPTPHIQVTDSLDRKAHVYAEPIRVVVDHYTHLPTLSPLP